MKTVMRICILFAVLSLSSLAQITSNGTGGGDWNTAATWAGGVVPTSLDNVTILSGDSVSLAASGSCAQLTMNGTAKLAINIAAVSIPGTSWNLSSTSTVYFNGPTTVQTGPTYGNLFYMTSSTGGVSTTSPASLTINGNFVITTGTFRGISAVSGTVTHTVAGDVTIGPGASARMSTVNSSNATAANCTWNISGNVTMTGAASTNRIILHESAGPHNGTATININGNLTVSTSSQVQYRSSTSATSGTSAGTVNVKGNVTMNGIISSSSGGTGYNQQFNLNGSSGQQYTGVFPNAFPSGQTMTLTVNNPAGVTMNSAATVNANVTLALTSGKLTTTNTNLVTVGATGAVSGGSTSSFIDGPLAFTWSTSTATKTYPLGKGSAYRPLEIALTTPTSPVIRAELFNSNPGGTSALDRISVGRYYQTSLISGTAASGGTVKITYGGDDGVQAFSTLVVAQSSTVNGTYSTLGNNASDATSVTSASYNPSNGDFLVLGSTSLNTLPVEMSSFSAQAVRGGVVLHWSTATEVNNNGFEIQKLDNGGWSTIGSVQGAGTSNVRHEYTFTDNAAKGAASYRLKQTDRDGAVTYSAVVEARSERTATEYGLTQNYPNPFNPSTTMSFTLGHTENAVVKVYDIIGKEVATLFNGVAQADQIYTVRFDAKHLASSVYYYSLHAASRHEVKRMLLVK